jgi:hypothetical protein
MDTPTEVLRTRRTARASEIKPSLSASQKYSRQGTLSEKDRVKDKNSFRRSRFMKCLLACMPGSPAHLSLKKTVVIAKRSSTFGLIWDISQVLFSILACALYVSETYVATHAAVEIYDYSELIVTQFFLVDFLFNWFVASNTVKYFKSFMTLVDVVTIVPVYITLALGNNNLPNLSLLRFLRILRLIRILRTFKLLGGVSGIKRQLITLSLTLLSLTFMAAGVVQVMENDVKQISYDCQFVNEFTDYKPSCDSTFLDNDELTCDCAEHECTASYTASDNPGEPSYIRCNVLPYFNCFYFIVVTMATVGM